MGRGLRRGNKLGGYHSVQMRGEKCLNEGGGYVGGEEGTYSRDFLEIEVIKFDN